MRLLLLSCILAITGLAAHAQACLPLRFKPGSFSGSISDTLSPSQFRCYTLEVGSGQTARIAILGENMCLTIPGVIDCTNETRFRTRAGTYTIRVSQMFRSGAILPFTLTAEVR